MKELIDLYAKMIIGTFTFIGPSFTLLNSLFFNHLERNSERAKERLQSLTKLADPMKPIQELVAHNKRATNLLNPKRQVVRLFGSLLLALIFIAFYYFQSTEYCNFKSIYVKGLALGSSGICYIYALICLWQVFCVIIDSKVEEEKENKIRKEDLLKTKEN